MAWDETSPITGKRIPIRQNSNIPQNEKISTYAQHPQALYEDFGIENKSFQENFAKLSTKKRYYFLNNTYDDIASDDSAIIRKINESSDLWSATKINKLGRNQTKVTDNLNNLEENFPVNSNTNLNYSFRKDVPTIQELRSHSLDNPLRNSKLIGPEGKNDLYQFTIKNHDGTVITEDRIKSPWPLTIQESEAEKEVKTEMEDTNKNTNLKNDAPVDDTPPFLKNDAPVDDTPPFLKNEAQAQPKNGGTTDGGQPKGGGTTTDKTASGSRKIAPMNQGWTGRRMEEAEEVEGPTRRTRPMNQGWTGRKQEISAADGEVQAGNGKSAAYKDGRLDDSKEFTAERKLENEKKDYWNKRKAKLGGHGKAALAVGTAVTAGALVLGLSNSRGQQSNAQLYGQQPLSY